MNHLPSELLSSLQGTPGFDREEFEHIHASGEQVTSIRINPAKVREPHALPVLAGAMPVPWSQYGYYLPQRPSFTFDPLFHAGTYYVQEASSMFIEQALLQTTDTKQPLRVLDLCAAPGGKSTHLQALLSPDSLLVSNEVIRSRASILRDNIQKWGTGNVVVTNNDPKDFNAFQGYFDVIMVDAPCSGSGLFRREPEAIAEWSENNVTLCSQRQQRILSDIWPALKEGGILIYSTCSYSQQEDEAIADWMQQSLQARFVPLTLSQEWQITDTGTGYRFWPYQLKGEGFFLACFQKTQTNAEVNDKIKKTPTSLTKSENEIVDKWINKDGVQLIRHEQTVYAWPELLANEMNKVLQRLHVIYSGTLVGELMRDKLIPDHTLVMNPELAKSDTAKLDVDLENAIRFLQKKEMNISATVKGWHVITYKNYALGWVNVLSGRINNYYPKNLRILKDKRDEN